MVRRPGRRSRGSPTAPVHPGVQSVAAAIAEHRPRPLVPAIRPGRSL